MGKNGRGNGGNIPPDLDGVSKEKIEQIDDRLNKCYSTADHKLFAKDVTEIVMGVLGSDDGRKKMKEHAAEVTQGLISGIDAVKKSEIPAIVRQVLADESFKQKSFIVPTVIAGLSLVVAAAALFINRG